MSWFQRLLLITIAATFVLVIIGGTVRATDSGLGCPDWPTCHGELIPSGDHHTLIEFSHRTAAAVVGFLFLGVTFFAFKTERKRPAVFWTAFAAGIVLVVQIVLGGITVKRELPSEIVAAHLAVAMTFMALLIITATMSLGGERRDSGNSGFTRRGYPRLVWPTAAITFATLVLGSYISGTDAALACEGWPLCNGSVAPGGGSDEGLHFLHRLLAGLLGVMLLGVIWQAFDERRPRALIGLTVFAGVTYLAQALIGAANIWTELAAGVVVTHLTLAALLWCTMVAMGALSYYLPGARSDAAALEGGAESRKVAGWAR